MYVIIALWNMLDHYVRFYNEVNIVIWNILDHYVRNYCFVDILDHYVRFYKEVSIFCEVFSDKLYILKFPIVVK